METKELKINIPEGYEIDKEKSTFEKIVFKKKENKPRSWKEYLCSGNHPNRLWFINQRISSTECNVKDFDLNRSNCHMAAYLPSKELAEAFLAMMQLMSLRQAWIGDWKPDWIRKTNNHCINICDNEYNVAEYARAHQALSFPTREMAVDFMNCFKGLLKQAKPLI